MVGGRKTMAICTREKLEGSVVKGFLQRGILLPLMCCLVVDEVREGLDGNGCFTLEYALSSSAKKILKYYLTASSGGFEYGIRVVW